MTIEDNHEDQNFVFGSDDSEPDFHHAASDTRLEKLSQKVTIISILIPCIIGILIVFIYLDMKNKVVQVHTSGSTEVHKISDELTKTIEGIKTESRDIETRISKKLSGMESSIKTLSTNLNKAEKNISFMTVSKANKKAVDSDLASLKAEAETLRKTISELSAQNAKLVTIAGELKNRLDGVDTVKKSLEQLEIDLAYLKANLIEKTEFNTELKKQKLFYQLEIQELSKRLDQKIDAVKASIPKSSTATPAPLATSGGGVKEQTIN